MGVGYSASTALTFQPSGVRVRVILTRLRSTRGPEIWVLFVTWFMKSRMTALSGEADTTEIAAVPSSPGGFATVALTTPRYFLAVGATTVLVVLPYSLRKE